MNAEREYTIAGLYSTPFFTQPLVDATPDGFAVEVLVHGEVYLKSMEERRANLDTLRLLQPMLLALMGGIGFFAGVMVNRRQKRGLEGMPPRSGHPNAAPAGRCLASAINMPVYRTFLSVYWSQKTGRANPPG